tara:strand:+ start:1642 stop:2055 length:414 start_codon:yes stop_codon:yes gene_type:complete
MDDKVIHDAAALVEEHYKDEKFLFKLGTIQKFNYAYDSGHDVRVKIFNSDIVMNIVPYKTKLPWSKAIGYASGDTIYVNTRKLDLPLADRVENFMHEPMHLLGYSHKGNYNNEFNRGTVPYRVAEIFRKYLESIGKL